MKVVFLGPPGAGKGTQAAIISKAAGIPTISTGMILRDAMAQGTVLGKEAEGYVKKGELVPDDVIIGIVKERLIQPDCEKGYILDGFPRTVAQAQALDDMLPDALDTAFSFEVADSEIMARLTGRRECGACGAIYHIKNGPSAKGSACEKCDGELIQRADDKEETIRNRMDVYHRQTEPIKDYYKQRGKLVCVDASGEPERLAKELLKRLGL